MGCPKNSTVSQRKNILRMATHKCCRATNDCAPEEAKGSGNIDTCSEEACIWIGDDDDDNELAEDAQQNVSSNSLSIIIIDGEEESDIHPSDSLHYNMILSEGIASWYQSVADARASNKQPRQYRGDSKFRYRETPFTNSEEQMLQNMHECLDSVPVDCIRWYAVMTLLELSTH